MQVTDSMTYMSFSIEELHTGLVPLLCEVTAPVQAKITFYMNLLNTYHHGNNLFSLFKHTNPDNNISYIKEIGYLLYQHTL